MSTAKHSPTAPLSFERALVTLKCASLVEDAQVEKGHVVLRANPAHLFDLIQTLKNNPELQLNFLVSVTAVDWMDKEKERFEVVYHLLSLSTLIRVRVRAWVPEQKPEVKSLVPLWHSANFMEREVWDMYGIVFSGHPDLRRILMYDEFKGHPLRKDYPIQGKQPRVALRHPEVMNTARDMHRPKIRINTFA